MVSHALIPAVTAVPAATFDRSASMHSSSQALDLDKLARASRGRPDDGCHPSFAALESSSPGGEGVERARGRREADWDQLYAWFAGPGARQLRDGAQQEVGTLLVSLKRINAAATKEASLRRHFLKLATWFDSSSPDMCHALATSAFGL
jgi:hypothetical protein